MQPLSPDARSILHVVLNVGPTLGGYVPPDHTKVLFPEVNQWREAVSELMRGGFITANDKGDLKLTDAGLELAAITNWSAKTS